MKAILKKTATGTHLSKIIDPLLCQIVLDVYLQPQQFAELISLYDEKEMELVIIDKDKKKE